MPVNYDRKRRKADRMIRRWGGAARLRRKVGATLVYRDCVAVIISYTPQDHHNRLLEVTDMRCLISALAPDGTVLEDPVKDKDVLVTADDKVWSFVQAPTKTAPDMLTNVFWDVPVRAA